ncbi:TonB-dependent receptor-like protein [Idiomarina loihiensis]|uniref:TonB-dependent receptor domain-containing protein n=1 Tax=Idiomarina TaxID=135575 RepID=UPI000D71601E|nr:MULTISPECIES: TonB-dependent receptor [Idiomarina]PWW41742.1 TonB-dependent receptor-like protein [Idiomarina loihiensis]TDP50800.1 TonB-dependent receptor-like protein [Idiomarina loihiensis]TDS24922.1 TonB-dependent receptor-like protein [Idiomarina sp. H2]
MKNMTFRKSLTAAAVAASLGFPVLAIAQENVDRETMDVAEEQSAQEQQPERIQVTGSRIRTDAFANETPIDIISVEDAEKQGLNTLGELLRTSTVAAGSSQITQAFATGYVTNGGAGAETISMRGLGANRTLVLLNGRRAGPAGTRGAVSSFDMNALPISAIERVEVLKDGASSLYGSDAVAGVINIITKTDDSKTFSVDLSQPFESGGESQRINGSWGETFDKGSIRFVADYNVKKKMERGDRDFYACTQRYLFNEDGTRGDPIDPRTGDYHCNDTGYGMWAYGLQPGAKVFYDYDGWLESNGYESINDQPGGLSGPEGWFVGAYDKETDGLWNLNHPFRNKETMLPENKTLSLYLQGDYQLTDTISVYSELLHSARSTETQGYRQFWTGDVGAIPAENLGFEGDALLMPVALTDHYGSDVDVDYTRFVGGIEGSIGFWDWDISYQNSYNKGTYGGKVIFADSMMMAQTNALNGTNCDGEVTAKSGKTCTDVNFADPQLLYGNPSQEVRDFLFGTEEGETIYKQQTLEAYITGDLMNLPAGPVGAAFGMSYQKDEIDDKPGETSANGNSWGLSSASRTAGSQNTKAVFGEVRVPILADLTFAQAVDVTGSFRWTDVSTYGSDSTFKLGLNWAINDDWRVRASRGTSFRSPALYELYLSGQTAFPGQRTVDPCYDYGTRYEEGGVSETVYQNCQADGIPLDYDGSGTSSVNEITSGGGDRLKAETSVAESAGLVWTSPEDTFAASIDYYDIQISGQVSKLTSANIVGTCYRSADFPNDPLCDLFTRNGGENGDWGIDEVQAGYVNVASQGVRGVDISLSYQDEFDFGDIRVVLEHTNQIDHTYQLFADSEVRQYIGEIGEPKHVGQLYTTFSRDDWSLTWTMRYADSVSNLDYYHDGSNETAYRGETYNFVGEVGTTVYHTLSGNMELVDGLDLTLGVANIFDKEPPKVSTATDGVSTTGNAVIYSQYDQLGRRVFANLTYSF